MVDDQGQAIRSLNFVNPEQNNQGGLSGLLEDVPTASTQLASQGKSNCILISNMFDSKQVDLDKDPSFFIDIKNSVQEVCQSWGKIDHIYVEQKS